MDWTHRGADDASTWLARRPVAVSLAVAGAVVLALVGVGCSQGSGAGNIVAGGSGSGCPTQGVGGDTLAPACVSPTGESSSGTNPIPGPVGPTGANPSPGISGPATASGPPAPTPRPGISGPQVPSTPPPQAATAPPQVATVFPATGAGAGGDSVTITGSGFTGATQVDFGGISAVMNVISDTEITATSPPGSGTVDITVVTPNGVSAIGPGDQFGYVS